MSDFTIWGRVTEMSGGSFLATASAIPLAGATSEVPVSPLNRYCATRMDADSDCRSLVQAMREALESKGHRVLSVDIGDLEGARRQS